ncbi:hypothetical protein B484DRAFT_425146 [Ochromonadaceae sp. CCMP2298]|nr:hypothetical protein B484DRAFT_425146 [Ochromonadaceae sp. CCMP2298]
MNGSRQREGSGGSGGVILANIPRPLAATAPPPLAPSVPGDKFTLYSADDGSLRVSRIYLEGAPYYHRRYWDTVIMPRLRVFRDAVVAVREDDGLRYRFLLAGRDEKLQLLQQLCPYYDIPDR